jgi:TolB-like protein
MAIYIVGAWVALQAADLAFPGLGIEESAILYVWIGAILGLPIALFFGWRYDIIGGRIVRTAVSDVDADLSIARADYVILVALSVVIAVIAFGLVGEISKTRVPETTQFAVTDMDPNSIAVLPFVNMSSDPEQEYFSDGISEEILNLLAQVQEMRVTSRSSAFSFKGRNVDVPTIAAKLNVAHVLEGSVRKSGNQLRITAQLIEVVTDTHLWSQTYDRELEDIFAIQDDIAGAVVDALKITLLGEKPKATETNPEAYALYLQGRHVLYQFAEGSDKRAETLLKQALEIDPGFAPAWTQLGALYFYRVDIELARDAIQRALDADPQYGRAYALLARNDMEHDWDFAAAHQHQQQALALDPGDAEVLRWAGWTEFTFGRIDEAIDLTRRSIALDPAFLGGYWNLGYILYCAHRLEEAADSLQMALSLGPGVDASHWGLGVVLLAQGDAPAALIAMEQMPVNSFFGLHGTAIVQHALGNAGASDAALRALIECCAEHGETLVAQAYAFRNEIDLAFDWLDQAYDERDDSVLRFLRDPLFANLHDDPRWDLFLEKMGLPHE